MNITIISNSAPDYYRFYNALAKKISAHNIKIQVAVDCSYTKDYNQINMLGANVSIFSDYFKNFNEDPNDILAKYSKYPLNIALLSDFERAEVFNLGRDRDNAYYLKLQAALIKYYENIFIKAETNLVLYENVSNTFAHYAWFVCQELNIPYCGLIASRLPGRFSVVNDPYGEYKIYSQILNDIIIGKRPISEDIQNWTQKYLSSIDHIQPDYMKFNKLDNLKIFNRYANPSKIRKLRLALKHINDNHRFAFQVGNPLRLAWQMFMRTVKRRIRTGVCKKFYRSPTNDKPFLLYPLHFHPESSTSVAAATYLDEYEVIRNIAFNLPTGLTLYVKDHVSAFGLQPLQFYKRIAALPNVCLIGPKADTKQLIRDSLAVITLTSTVGYEALLLNRRVFLYGSVFYEFHPNVVKVIDPSSLFELFQHHLHAPLPVGPEYNDKFVAAYYMGTYPGILNFSMNDEDTHRLVEEIFPTLLGIFHERVHGTNCTQ